MKKRKHIYLDFSLLYPLCIFFCILNLKIHAKKDKNAKKKQTKIVQIAKIYMQKKVKKEQLGGPYWGRGLRRNE